MKKVVLAMMLFALPNEMLQAQTTGDASVQTVKTVKTNGWQNWAFGASLLLTAAAAIFVISINNGNEIQSTSH